MKRFPFILILALSVLGLSGCSGDKSETVAANVVVFNATPRTYWVELHWKGPEVPVGYLVSNGRATAVGVDWPLLPSLKVMLMDRETKERCEFDLSLAKLNEELRSKSPSKRKTQSIVIKILGPDKAEAVLE